MIVSLLEGFHHPESDRHLSWVELQLWLALYNVHNVSSEAATYCILVQGLFCALCVEFCSIVGSLSLCFGRVLYTVAGERNDVVWLTSTSCTSRRL